MTTTTKPPHKELTRAYLEDRTHSEDPPPSQDEIRRQMGWLLIPQNRDEREVPD